jgi:hypothetical protein
MFAQKLLHYNEAAKNTDIGRASGVEIATMRLISVLGDVKVAVDPSKVPGGAIAAYLPGSKTIYLREHTVTGRDATHETVHAYNDIMRTSVRDDARLDEGTAYGVTGLLEHPIQLAVNLERSIKNSKGCPELRTISGLWRGLWSRYPGPASLPIGKVRRPGPLPDYEFDLNATDMRNVRTIFSLGVSCYEYAAVMNLLLGGKGCCYHVDCAAGPDDFATIHAGVQIDGSFQ